MGGAYGTNGCLVPGVVMGVGSRTRGYVGGYYLHYDTNDRKRYWVQEVYDGSTRSWQLVVWGEATWRKPPTPFKPPIALAEFGAKLRDAGDMSEAQLSAAARW